MPLRLRLTLWYGGLTSLVLLTVGLLTYGVHSHTQYDDLDGMLVGAAEHIAAEALPAQSLGTPGDALAPITTSPNLAVRLYGAAGEVLATTPGSEAAPNVDPRVTLAGPPPRPYDPLVAFAPSLTDVAPGRGVFGLATGAGGERWRLYVLPPDRDGRYLVAAAPLGRIDASVDELRRLVALLVVVGTAVTLAGGWAVAGRALRPVAALTDAADAIARSQDVNRRVPVSGRQDELGRLAVTFNAMLASLERASEAQRRFVADASHELRAPLTAIQANLELLERRPDMPPAERQEAVSEATRETQRLTRLVADLLTLARADAGVPLRRRRIELDQAVMEAFGEARHLARGQRLEVQSLEPATVEGDPDRLKQLLLALLDNALKYTPAGGQVTLGLRRNGVAAEVSVRDNGVGIPAEDLPHVFDRFYRADPARARDPGGTGLGLSIARWIARQHGGDVALTSAPGSGTTATIRLPLSR